MGNRKSGPKHDPEVTIVYSENPKAEFYLVEKNEDVVTLRLKSCIWEDRRYLYPKEGVGAVFTFKQSVTEPNKFLFEDYYTFHTGYSCLGFKTGRTSIQTTVYRKLSKILHSFNKRSFVLI